MRRLLFLLLLSLFLFACSQEKAGESVSEVGKRACIVQEIANAPPPCKDGDLFMFLPQVFGNRQLPVVIAGHFCDFNYPVVWTEGGVACVYTSARIQREEKK